MAIKYLHISKQQCFEFQMTINMISGEDICVEFFRIGYRNNKIGTMKYGTNQMKRNVAMIKFVMHEVSNTQER